MSANKTRNPSKFSLRARLLASIMPAREDKSACDRHMHWLEQWRDTIRRFEDAADDTLEFDDLWIERRDLEARIAQTAAGTAQDAAAQLLWVFEDGDLDAHEPHSAALKSVLGYLRGDV